MRFRTGERVKYIGDEARNLESPFAKIMKTREEAEDDDDYFASGYDYALEFEETFDNSHDCSGYCNCDYGLWAKENQLLKLEEEEEKMIFEIGDRVRAISACDNDRRFIGEEGTVKRVENLSGRIPVLVKFDNGREWFCEPTSLENLTRKEKEEEENNMKKVDISKIKNKIIVNFGDDHYSSEYKIIKVKSLEELCKHNTERFAKVIADKIVVQNKYNLRIFGDLNSHIQDVLIEVNCNNWRLDGGDDCYEAIKTLPSGLRSIVVDLDTGNYYDYIPDGFEKCKHCGRLVKKAYIMGERCDYCITKDNGLGERYGYHDYYDGYKLLDKTKVDTSKTLTFGCEIERDYIGGDNFSKDLHDALVGAVKEMYTKKELEKDQKSHRKAVFMCDGSLSYDGIEYITFPATYKWYKKNKNTIQRVLEVMRQFGFDNSSSCGNHIHFNRSFFKDKGEGEDKFAGAKMALLLNEYWEEFKAIAKRDCTDYCEKPRQKKSDSIFTIVDKTNQDEHNHSVAINLQHNDTIECRIWSGIDSADELLFYLDVTQSIAKFVKKYGLEKCQRAKFGELFKFMTDKAEHLPMIKERLQAYSHSMLDKHIKELDKVGGAK